MYRDPAFARTRTLFTGHAAGAFTLPDELVDARRRADALLDRLRDPGIAPKLPATRGRYLEELHAAVDAGAELPDPLVLRQAAEHDRGLDELRRILGDEAEHAQTVVVGIVQRLAVPVLARHLRPALEETIDAARKAADALGGRLPSPDAAVSASAPERKAYLELDGLAARYRAIRDAQRIAADLTDGPRFDDRGLFGEFRNLPAVWTEWANPRAAKPWPAGDRARLVWIVTSGVEPWLPTPADQDAAFAATFPKAPILRGRSAGVPVDLEDLEELADA